MSMLGIKTVSERVDLSPVTIWRRMQVGDFPKPVQLTPNRKAWTEKSIQEWEESRPVGQCELPANFNKKHDL